MRHPRAVAVAQTCPVPGDVAANLEQHVRLARVAAAERAEVVLFPELSLTGYEMALAGACAFAERDPRLAPLVEVAASHSLTLIAGAPARLGERLHIGAFILRPDRSVDLYTKQRLGAFTESARCDGVVPPAEATVFHPGDRNPLVRFGGNLGAVAVCADVGRPSHPREAAARGAGTYFASMFVIPSEYAGEVAKLTDHAVRHSMVVAFANYGGPSGGLASAGRSAIWSESGQELARLGPRGPGVVVAREAEDGWRATAIPLDDGPGIPHAAGIS